MRYANARIAISKGIGDLIKRKYDLDAEVIPNGVAAVAPRLETDYIRSLGLEPGKYFVQVGRLVPEKRQLDLIRAYQAISPCDWKLVIVGALATDAYSREVKAAADSPGVVLTGFLKGCGSAAGLFACWCVHASVVTRRTADRHA